MNDTLVSVKGLKMYFPVARGLLRRKIAEVRAVDDVSFHVKTGETLGLVGETGCGKTTTGQCILRLYRPTAGQIIFEGHNISHLHESKIRSIRRKMPLIFQDLYGSLDPRQSAGSIVGEPIKFHKLVGSNKECRDRVAALFRMVGLDPDMVNRIPHEFSGGQRQRIGIARALACEPSMIVCNEPFSALDVSIQLQIINLLEDLQKEFKWLTYIFIAHDLLVVRYISDRVAVMYLGRIVETTASKELYMNPLHPYTQALISAVPIPDRTVDKQRQQIVLRGEVPSPLNPPSGCHFHPRCPIAGPDCSQVIPPLVNVGNSHEVACIKVKY